MNPPITCQPRVIAETTYATTATALPAEGRCEEARRRLRSVSGDPFVFAEWRDVVFLQFVLEPGLVRPEVPAAFELELHHGMACVSLVAVTMRRFRPATGAASGRLLRTISEQRF